MSEGEPAQPLERHQLGDRAFGKAVLLVAVLLGLVDRLLLVLAGTHHFGEGIGHFARRLRQIGNATPLMMGAIAYLILFIPVVVLGRFLETRFTWRRV